MHSGWNVENAISWLKHCLYTSYQMTLLSVTVLSVTVNNRDGISNQNENNLKT